MTPQDEKLLRRHFTSYLDSRRRIDSLTHEGKIDIAEATEQHTDAWMALTSVLTDAFVGELMQTFDVKARRVSGGQG